MATPESPPFLTKAYGPCILTARNNRGLSLPLERVFMAQRYTLWTWQSGALTVHGDAGDVQHAGPGALLHGPHPPPVSAAAGTDWNMLVFDAVHQPRLPDSGGPSVSHCTPVPQPAALQVWGFDLPETIPDGLLDAALRTMRFVQLSWWRSHLSHLRANAELTVFLAELAERVGSAAGETGGDWYQRASRLVRANLDVGAGVADMARAAGMPASTFRRRFRERAGVSPATFLQRCRMERAAELLLRGELNVKAVAEMSGYRSAATFSAQFRRHFGSPPREWASSQRD